MQKKLSKRLEQLEQKAMAGNETGRLFELAMTGDVGDILTYIWQCKQATRPFDDDQHQAWCRLMDLLPN